MTAVHSYAEAEPQFTESGFQWVHTAGASGTDTNLMVFVATVDSENVEALSATFSGVSLQAMTLAHEVTAPGTSFPAQHIFSLTDPSFFGPTLSGIILVELKDTATVVSAVSVVATGVDTGQGINGVGSFNSTIHHAITSVGEVSGTITSAAGNTILDCVVANAGKPDDHTVGYDQELLVKSSLDSQNSAAVSLSVKLALNTGETGMIRTDVTSLNTITCTAMVVYSN
jgi:hypothetical protein